MTDSSKKHKIGFHPFKFLFGYSLLSFPSQLLQAALGVCREKGISFRVLSVENGKATLLVPFFKAKHLVKKIYTVTQCEAERDDRGLPSLVLKNKSRLGLYLGALVGILMISLSQAVIWDVRIDGATRLTDTEVRQTLSECGLSVGSLKSSLDIDVIENRVLIVSDDISWISVNVIGTVAKVEIRELDLPPDTEEELPPAANLVAKRGGVIVGFENVKGNIAVNIGDSVGEGQLLVGGIYGDELRGFRYTSASGKVFAEIEKTLSFKISRLYTKKVYTGKAKYEKTLLFFGKEIKFFENSGNLYPLYDKIEVEEYLRAPNGDRLPFGVRTVKYLEYSYTQQKRSDDELFSMAEYRMNALICESGELLKRKSSIAITQESCRVQCDIEVIENIARLKEIPID